VEEPACGVELGLADGLALGEERGPAVPRVPAAADPAAVTHSAAARPASHPAVRTARLLRIVKA
jgi:hypothetical protein